MIVNMTNGLLYRGVPYGINEPLRDGNYSFGARKFYYLKGKLYNSNHRLIGDEYVCEKLPFPLLIKSSPVEARVLTLGVPPVFIIRGGFLIFMGIGVGLRVYGRCEELKRDYIIFIQKDQWKGYSPKKILIQKSQTRV